MLQPLHFKDHFYFADELPPKFALHASVPIVPQIIAEKLTTLPSLANDAWDTSLFIASGLDLIDTSLFEPDPVVDIVLDAHSWDHRLIVHADFHRFHDVLFEPTPYFPPQMIEESALISIHSQLEKVQDSHYASFTDPYWLDHDCGLLQ